MCAESFKHFLHRRGVHVSCAIETPCSIDDHITSHPLLACACCFPWAETLKHTHAGWMLYGLRRRPERLDRHPEVRAELTALGFSWEVPRKGSRGPRKRKPLASGATLAAATPCGVDGRVVVAGGGGCGDGGIVVVAGADGVGIGAGVQDGAVSPNDLVLNALHDSAHQANQERRPTAECNGDGESGRVLAGGLALEDAETSPRLLGEKPQATVAQMAAAVDDAGPTLPSEVAATPNRADVGSVGGLARRKRSVGSVGGGSGSNGGTPRPQTRKRADRGLAPAAQWLLEGSGVMVTGRRRHAGGSAGPSAAPGAHL